MEINIAGAGAGKTTKMSDKIILLRNQIDAEKKIFCVAFTNSAVDCIRRKLCEHYVQIPENIIVSTIHSFLYREIIKPYYHLLYGKKYEKISIAELPQDAKYKNAKIKRLDDMNVLHQTVIPEHAKWVLCKKSKDTKNIKDGRQIIKNAIVKYCGAICIDEVQDIDKHMQEIIEELSGMEIPMILMGDPKQDLKGFTREKKDAMTLLSNWEKIDSRRYGIIINLFEDESPIKQEDKIFVKSIDYIKGMEGEKCLFILTNDLAAHLFNNNTETNKTKNKLYVALTRSLNELSIYILKEVEDKYTKKRIQDFFERYL